MLILFCLGITLQNVYVLNKFRMLSRLYWGQFTPPNYSFDAYSVARTVRPINQLKWIKICTMNFDFLHDHFIAQASWASWASWLIQTYTEKHMQILTVKVIREKRFTWLVYIIPFNWFIPSDINSLWLNPFRLGCIRIWTFFILIESSVRL